MDLGLLSWLPHRGGTSCRVMLPLSWALWWTPGPQSELCTLRVRPSDLLGYFSAYQPRLNTSVVYHWERAAFPFLVTWEEDHARTHKPWNGRELTRGLEFSSYALPASREWNVKQGTVMDTPAFQVAPVPWVKCVPNLGAVWAIHLTSVCLPRGCSVCRFDSRCARPVVVVALQSLVRSSRCCACWTWCSGWMRTRRRRTRTASVSCPAAWCDRRHLVPTLQ